MLIASCHFRIFISMIFIKSHTSTKCGSYCIFGANFLPSVIKEDGLSFSKLVLVKVPSNGNQMTFTP